ncbi:MAG: hypothetical protein PVH26_07230 [Desulfosarcina sp.]|jgi:hypothetical protein
MTFKHTSHGILSVFLPTLVFFLIAQTICFAAQKDKKEDYVMSETELQSELMGYADRFASLMVGGYEQYLTTNPTSQERQFIQGDLIFSLSSMYTIAAGPNPQVGLLDMVAVTTLGRIIYEENVRRKYGPSIEVLAARFRQLETDIWKITAKVLTVEQQKELRDLILLWRKNNPEKVVYNYMRFSDFAAQRRNSTLVKKVSSGGLFGTVKQVTQQVEETRMLAERGIFLGTRLPLLTGAFADLWMSKLILNPEAQKILADIHTFSEVSERFANVAEQLPDRMVKDVSALQKQMVNQVMRKVAVERKAAINQFMDRLVGKNKVALDAVMAQDQQIIGVVNELRQTIEGTNALLLTAGALAEKYDTGEPSAEAKDAKPFDIQEYRETIIEVTKLVESTNQLVASVGIEDLLPQLVKAIDEVGGEGQELVDHGFRQGVFFMLIVIGAYLVGRLIYNFLNQRLIESRR